MRYRDIGPMSFPPSWHAGPPDPPEQPEPMFVMDDFARRHLREWFQSGGAPYGWDLGDLEAFEAWCETNAEDLPEYASWPNLARQFDQERSNG